MITDQEYEVTIEDVVVSLTGAVESMLEYEKAYEQYRKDGGYEWGYHGWPETERKQKALTKLQADLDGYINSRIASAVKIALEEKQ